MTRALAPVAIFVTAVFGVACESCSPVNATDSTVPSSCSLSAPLIAPVKTDILFVVDNSDSMADKQAEVAAELPAFIAELQQGAGVQHDFQVGVITTSVYQYGNFGNGNLYLSLYPSESGRLQATPIVGEDGGWLPGTEKVLVSTDPQLVSKFDLLVRQGISGSGQETPFEAIRKAVTPPLSITPLASGGNQEFFRDGARLLVVVVSDADDCSEEVNFDPPNVVDPVVSVGSNPDVDDCANQSQFLAPVADYFNVLHGLTDSTGEQRQVLWADLAPVSEVDKSAVYQQYVYDDGGMSLHAAGCPNAEGTGVRDRQMGLMFDSTLNDLNSVCLPSYHDWLLSIAAVANTTQTLDISGVPDPALLKVEITRANGQVDSCTIANGGITYEAPANGRSGKIDFQSSCLRTATDTAVQVQLLCIG